MEVNCEDEKWMELAQDYVKWRALINNGVGNYFML
jgi:hypothetical protein